MAEHKQQGGGCILVDDPFADFMAQMAEKAQAIDPIKECQDKIAELEQRVKCYLQTFTTMFPKDRTEWVYFESIANDGGSEKAMMAKALTNAHNALKAEINTLKRIDRTADKIERAVKRKRARVDEDINEARENAEKRARKNDPFKMAFKRCYKIWVDESKRRYQDNYDPEWARFGSVDYSKFVKAFNDWIKHTLMNVIPDDDDQYIGFAQRYNQQYDAEAMDDDGDAPMANNAVPQAPVAN